MPIDPPMVSLSKMRQLMVFFVSTEGKLSVTVTIVWYGNGGWTPSTSGVEDKKGIRCP